MDTTATSPDSDQLSPETEDIALATQPAAPDTGAEPSAQEDIPPQQAADIDEIDFLADLPDDADDDAPAPEPEAPAPEPEGGDDPDADPAAEDQPQDDPAPPAEDEPKPPARNYRLTAKDEAEARAFELYKRNPDMTLEEALQKVTGRKVDPAAPSGDSAPSAEGSGTPPSAEESPESLEARREHLEAELIRRSEEFDDGPETRKLQFELARIPEKLIAARERQARADATQRDSANEEFRRLEARAVELYPDAAVPGSPLFERMAEIDADLIELNDPLAWSPDKALRIAQMAAAELAIAPRSRKAQAPAQQPPPAQAAAPAAPPPAAPKLRPSSGAATGGVPSSDPQAAERYLKSITTEEDLERLVATL